MQYKTKHLKFKSLYKEAFDKNPLLDYTKIECYLSVIMSIITVIILYFLYKQNSASVLTGILQNAILYTGICLLGMLGFIISGLAIISGTVSNKIADEINKDGNFDTLLSILFSFYFIGAIIGFSSILYFISYFIVFLNFKFILILYLASAFILIYLVFFSILYSVSLLGTCINMFVINYNYSVNCDTKSDNSLDEIFNAFRIDALTYTMINKDDEVTLAQFINNLKMCILKDCQDDDIKEKLLCIVCEYYSLKENKCNTNKV